MTVLIQFRYMKGLRAIIDAMDDEISLAEQLKRIARAHIKWNIHKAHVMVSDKKCQTGSQSIAPCRPPLRASTMEMRELVDHKKSLYMFAFQTKLLMLFSPFQPLFRDLPREKNKKNLLFTSINLETRRPCVSLFPQSTRIY